MQLMRKCLPRTPLPLTKDESAYTFPLPGRPVCHVDVASGTNIIYIKPNQKVKKRVKFTTTQIRIFKYMCMLIFNWLLPCLCFFFFILPVENSEESDEEKTENNQDTDDRDFVSWQEPKLITGILLINQSINQCIDPF